MEVDEALPLTAPNLTRRKTIGGSKGHVEEEIEGLCLRLFDSFRWKMIPKCTGRYTCRDHDLVSHLQPIDLLKSLGIDARAEKQKEFRLPERDTIVVFPLDEAFETGIISYVKKEEGEQTRYVHTLNSRSGFQRKLCAIGILSLHAGNQKSTEPGRLAIHDPIFRKLPVDDKFGQNSE